MKKIVKAMSLLIFCFMFCIGCSKGYVGYAASYITPKTFIHHGDYEKWYTSNLELVDSYESYEEYNIDLGYTEEFFENTQLMILLKTGCSTDNLEFYKVLEKENKIYPVVKINPYGEHDYKTMDIIFYVFYAEVPLGYTIGETIMETRSHKVVK